MAALAVDMRRIEAALDTINFCSLEHLIQVGLTVHAWQSGIEPAACCHAPWQQAGVSACDAIHDPDLNWDCPAALLMKRGRDTNLMKML